MSKPLTISKPSPTRQYVLRWGWLDYLWFGESMPTTKKKKRRSFKGYDWMELIRYWNLKVRKAKVAEYMEENDVPDFEAWDKVAVDRARDYAHDAIVEGGPRLKEVAEDARAFLRALARGSEKVDYHAPVWRGILAIKKDAGGNETLLKFVSIYLDCMWT